MPALFFCNQSESYLRKSVEDHELCIGIVIGQKTADDKYYAIHFAKLSDDEESPGESSETADSPIDNINYQSMAEQWISASKMTPGSFRVLGIFVSSRNADINDNIYSSKIKKLLVNIQNLIINGSSTCGYTEDSKDTEILVVSYITSSGTASCKAFTNSKSGGILMPVDCKIVDKLPMFYLFETNYEVDDVFPISDNLDQINIENQFNTALQAVKTRINNSEIFIHQQCIDDSSTLEHFLSHNNNSKKNEVPTFRASIFLLATLTDDSIGKIRSFNGAIRFSGIVSSRVWCHPKNTFKEIKESIKRDVLRSLAARIQIYCDGLTEIHSNNIGVVVNEPPRRIYFSGNNPVKIQFSEYIFRGETPSVAVAQAKQVLDMDITSDCIYDDLESLPADDQEAQGKEAAVKEQPPAGRTDTNRTMYLVGIAAAILMLFLSILLHYLM